jgi:hypothetical protein
MDLIFVVKMMILLRSTPAYLKTGYVLPRLCNNYITALNHRVLLIIRVSILPEDNI